MSKTILIQLVGQQTLPNVVPVLVLKPNSVYNICTEVTSDSGNRLSSWLPANTGATPHLRCLKEKDLYLGTQAMIRCIMEQHPDARFIVNMTGGNKLMSLAAHRVACAAGNIPVVYVDSAASKDYAEMLYWVECPEQREEWCAHYNKKQRLRVMDIVELGEQKPDYKTMMDWRQLLPAAHAVQRLAPMVGTKVPEGALARLSRCARQKAEVAASFEAIGWNLTDEGQMAPHGDVTFLTGKWWEVLVAEHLEKSGKFSDVICALTTSISEACGPTDMDVLATDGVTLTCVSCKRQLTNPDSEINKHESRARKLGGINTHYGVAVYKGSYDSYLKLVQLCRAAKGFSIIGPQVCPSLPMPRPPQETPKKPAPQKGNEPTELSDILPPMTGSLADSFLR